MKVSVLIVDANATNRMALRVKLTGAWYDVAHASSGTEALAALDAQSADIVIASDTLKDTSLPDLIRSIARPGREQAPPVIALTHARCHTTEQRLALLEAGAEDVLHKPTHQGHLIARVRSVLRARSAEAEWRLRDTTSRALGFAEPVHVFNRAIPLAVLEQANEATDPALRAALDTCTALSLTRTSLPSALTDLDSPDAPDVVMVSLQQSPAHDPARALAQPSTRPFTSALATLADLRAHPMVRTKAILALVPRGAYDLAAQALDMGADDVAMAPPPDLFAIQIHASEIALRARRLHMRQQMTQSLRNTVRKGAEAALRDTLTGLYNRRYALPYLQRIARQSDETGRPFAVMVADLDHFKRINDTYGHAVGDEVLAECARRLQHNMRAMDLVARMGGEEFLIVLPGTGRADARKAALRLCARISETGIKVPGLAERLRVTISVGLALSNTQPDLFDPDSALMSDDPTRILHRADRALYQAKEQGRNQFRFERPAA